MNKRAVTLLEIIISMLILALLMAGLANIFISGKRYLLHTRARMTGGELGKSFLDPLQMDVRADLWDQTCLGSNGMINCPDNTTINGIDYTRDYNITDVNNTNPEFSLKKVLVRINWTEVGPGP
ncbi:prepilin-type N-terminal cleavage/methylation domain-containing protein [Candidatus Omnitrophota bacterium]